MKKYEIPSRVMPWLTALTLGALAAGCGGGGAGGQAPILGGVTIAPVAPMVTAVTPLPNASGVPVNTKVITAAFTKAMDPGTLTTANFTLTCPGTTPMTGTSVSYFAAGRLASLTLPAATNLPPSTLCTATVTSAVKDSLGIAMPSNFVWRFTTNPSADTTPPMVNATINANGAANVATNTRVGVSFTEILDPVTVNTNSFTLRQGTTLIPGTVTYSGVNAVFRPNVPLANNTTYSARISGVTGSAGGDRGVAVRDVAGNSMLVDYDWRWTTAAAPDTTAPTVTGTVNQNGAVNVATNARIGATFSEGMDPLTVNSANFTVQQGANFIPGVISYSGVSAVFTPLNALTPNTQYTVTVKGGATGVTDLADNPMVADFVISWTTAATADTTAPTVTGTVNRNGAINVAVNSKVGATFSEAMDPLTVTNANFTLKQGANLVPGVVSFSGVSAVFTPLSNLAPNTVYTVTVKGGTTGVTDLADNPMVADFVISWTTAALADTTPPTVTGTINRLGDINVAINTRVGATFSEDMDPLTVTTDTFSLKQGAINIPGTLSFAGNNLVFTPGAVLAANTLYTVTLKGGANGVSDLANNPMVSDFVLAWTTALAPDTTAPSVTLLNPADLAGNVAVTATVNATFSEPMDPLTVSTASFTVAGVTGTVAYNAASQIASFTPSTNLANNTQYTATLSTLVEDLAGNPLVSNKVWSFTTAAAVVIPPVIVPPVIDLQSAAAYGTFGGTAGMTNMGTLTQINGSIGTTATGSTSVTGFHDTAGDIYTETGSNIGAVNGTIRTCTNSTTGPTSAGPNAPACALATQARLDAQTAYLALAAKPPVGASPAPGANLAGITLLPGVYVAPGGSFLIEGGNLTLDAASDPNATWIFQMAGTLTVGGPGAAFPQSIILAGGAQAKNVFWQVGSFATINAGGGGTMVGTIISQAGVAFSTAGNVTPVTLQGRALSLGASVTLVNTVINVP